MVSNAIIVGYVQGGCFEEALTCFSCIQEVNVSPSKSTIDSVLSTCGHLGSLGLEKLIGFRVRDHGFGSNIQLVNAIVDMYCKCGEIDMAHELSDGIKEKNLISWNTMIGGYSYLSLYAKAHGTVTQSPDFKPGAITKSPGFKTDTVNQSPGFKPGTIT